MTCPICLVTIIDPLILPCCKNAFCSNCIQNWLQIKSTCPLCCAQASQQNINILLKRGSSQSFDDGSLMLETEINQIKVRIANISKRVASRRQQFQNRRSNTSAGLMQFLESQMEALRILEQSIDDHHLSNNRALCVQNMQLIVEIIFSIQGAFEGRWQNISGSDDKSQQDSENEESDYDEYKQYIYEMHSQKRVGNSKLKKGKNEIVSGQQKSKKTSNHN